MTLAMHGAAATRISSSLTPWDRMGVDLSLSFCCRIDYRRNPPPETRPYDQLRRHISPPYRRLDVFIRRQVAAPSTPTQHHFKRHPSSPIHYTTRRTPRSSLGTIGRDPSHLPT